MGTTSKGPSLQERQKDEKERIRLIHAELKVQFTERDRLRFPRGWKLPK